MEGRLIVISGTSSGAGKDAVTRGLEERGDFARIITYTTRKRRPGEEEEIDYHFINQQEFEEKKKAGFFLETNQYLGHLYGTPKKEILKLLKSGRDVLLRVDVNGAKSVKRQIPEAILVFIEAPFADMRRRLVKRAREKGEAIEKKIKFAREEMKEKKHFDYVVVNEEGKLAQTIKEVLEIIQKNEP